jgi:hypothetical protein
MGEMGAHGVAGSVAEVVEGEARGGEEVGGGEGREGEEERQQRRLRRGGAPRRVPQRRPRTALDQAPVEHTAAHHTRTVLAEQRV